jgi:RNA polymerase sigma-70 factor (ECF subfamily)
MSHYTNHKNIFKNFAPEDVFCAYYTQFRKYIHTHLLELTRDTNLANDLTQNVFLNFWTLKDQYPMIGNTKAYLKQMAENAFPDTRRQYKNQKAYIHSVSYNEGFQYLTEMMFAERELKRTFQQAILDLSKQRRFVFVLSQIEGWFHEKIAGTLGISPFYRQGNFAKCAA